MTSPPSPFKKLILLYMKSFHEICQCPDRLLWKKLPKYFHAGHYPARMVLDIYCVCFLLGITEKTQGRCSSLLIQNQKLALIYLMTTDSMTSQSITVKSFWTFPQNFATCFNELWILWDSSLFMLSHETHTL